MATLDHRDQRIEAGLCRLRNLMGAFAQGLYSGRDDFIVCIIGAVLTKVVE